MHLVCKEDNRSTVVHGKIHSQEATSNSGHINGEDGAREGGTGMCVHLPISRHANVEHNNSAAVVGNRDTALGVVVGHGGYICARQCRWNVGGRVGVRINEASLCTTH